MNFTEYIAKIEYVYDIIIAREEVQRKQNTEKGFYNTRVSFEDIDLDDIFQTELIPLIPQIQHYYKKCTRNLQFKVFKVYIAALCEMAKNGFTQGGINKTMDTYLGTTFDRNRHYDLLSLALQSEKIKILYEYGHHYEETIICEAGIPKNLHTHSLNLFKIYWKWLKGINSDERHQFLHDFLQEKPVQGIYILDPYDFAQMHAILLKMNTYKAKLFKTCLRLEDVFSAIDSYPAEVTSENIHQVCTKISEDLGRNILTIVRIKDLQQTFLEYARRVTFSKFQTIINGLNEYDTVLLPDGRQLNKLVYNAVNFVCGIHGVKGNEYEVSYRIGLSMSELLRLKRNEPIWQNKHILYISDYPFEVEIDGHGKQVRELYHNDEELYIFAGTIPAASTAYIDGICVTGDQDVYLSASVRKYWNREQQKNQLSVYIKEFKCSNKKYASENVKLICGDNTINRHLNSNGYIRFHDKTIILNGIRPERIDVIVNGQVIASKELTYDDLMVYGLQFGTRIDDRIDLSKWYGDNRIVIFSKTELGLLKGIEVGFQGKENDYFTYIGMVDFSSPEFNIGSSKFTIENGTKPYLILSPNFFVSNEIFCYSDIGDVQFQIANVTPEIISRCLLRITHDSYVKEFILQNIFSENISLKEIWAEEISLSGKWNIELFFDQERVGQALLSVLSKLRVKYDDAVYMEKSKFSITVLSDSKCFDVDSGYSDSIVIKSSAAKIEHIGNLITSQEITLEVYNSVCDVFQTINVKPNVWAVKILDLSTREWFDPFDKRLEFSDLSKYGIFICTTKGFQLDVCVNEEKTTREVLPGYNKVGVRHLTEAWRPVNKLRFLDVFGNESTVSIYYEPEIVSFELKEQDNGLNCILSYSGPIEVPIIICAFVDNKRILHIQKTIFHNNTELNFRVNNTQMYVGKTISIEVAFFDQDSKCVGSYTVKEKPSVMQVEIKDTLNVHALLDVPLRKGNLTVSKYSNIFDLLKIRGI